MLFAVFELAGLESTFDAFDATPGDVRSFRAMVSYSFSCQLTSVKYALLHPRKARSFRPTSCLVSTQRDRKIANSDL